MDKILILTGWHFDSNNHCKLLEDKLCHLQTYPLEFSFHSFDYSNYVDYNQAIAAFDSVILQQPPEYIIAWSLGGQILLEYLAQYGLQSYRGSKYKLPKIILPAIPFAFSKSQDALDNSNMQSKDNFFTDFYQLYLKSSDKAGKKFKLLCAMGSDHRKALSQIIEGLFRDENIAHENKNYLYWLEFLKDWRFDDLIQKNQDISKFYNRVIFLHMKNDCILPSNNYHNWIQYVPDAQHILLEEPSSHAEILLKTDILAKILLKL